MPSAPESTTPTKPTSEPPAGCPGDGAALEAIALRSRSLTERLAETSRGPISPLSDSSRSTLAAWARVLGGDATPHRLPRRLAWAGIDPRVAAAALGPPQESNTVARERAPWVRLLELYAQRARSRTAGELRDLGRRDFGEQAEAIPFLELWVPWLELAREPLAELLGDPGVSVAARRDLERNLLLDLAELSEAAAYEHFEIERPAQPGPGVEAYASFVERLVADPIGGFYGSYPVLARQTAERVEQWQQAVTALLGAVQRDREALAETFDEGSPPKVLTGVSSPLSDRHFGGRMVHKLTFASGLEVIFKPRDLGAESGLASFLEWAEEAGLPSTPPKARVLRRAGYGWMEFVVGVDFACEEKLEDYHRRAGALAAIGWILRGRDLHAENVVASRKGPVVIDAEMFLQPARVRFASGETSLPDRVAGDHCLATGLLTQLLPGGEEDRGLGGLRVSARLATRRFRRFVNRDAMRITLDSEELPPLPNVPRLRGQAVDPGEFASVVVAGFEETYRFLLDHRDDLLDPNGPLREFSSARIRTLLRGSQEYGRVLQLQRKARNQRSGLANSWMIEAMHRPWLDAAEQPLTWPVASAERRALERGDVPWFGLQATSKVLEVEGSENPLRGLFARSGLEVALSLIASLSESDLALQRERLLRSLAPASSQTNPAGLTAGRTASRLEIAGAIEAAIAQTVVAPNFLPCPRAGLGSGVEGVAFGLVAPIRGRSESDLVGTALERLRLAVVGGGGDEVDPASGLRLWALAWLTHWRDRRTEPQWAAAAESLAAALEACDPEGMPFDLDSGLAGAVLGLLAWGDLVGRDRWHRVAERLGDRLLARQEREGDSAGGFRNPLGLAQCGWAHGASGAARALSALHHAVGGGRFLEGARGALHFEDSRFDARRGNWPVDLLELESGRRETRWMTAWCRGAIGMALPRLAGMPVATEVSAALVEQLLDRAAEAPLQEIDHFCCGNFGRSAVLLTASEAAVDPEQRILRREQARRIARDATERAARAGLFALGDGIYTLSSQRAGLLKGLTGIRYQLLRLEGESLPDLARLELPSEYDRRVGS